MRNVFVNNSILLNGFSVYCYLSQFQNKICDKFFFCPAIFKSNQLKLTAISSADIFCKLFFSIMRADSCLYGIQLNQY